MFNNDNTITSASEVLDLIERIIDIIRNLFSSFFGG